ncbi:MAG: flagellar FliL protein [Candidatus Azotimanducaceae bacterium]|jgi:flagellar FliL protein
MAEEENTKEGKMGKFGKKKLIIIIVAALLLLGGIGGGVMFYLQSNEPEPIAEGGDDDLLLEDDTSFFSSDRPKALYHDLRPEFIVTFEANSRQRYVQLNVTLVARDEEIIAVLVNNDPVIRNTLVLLFSKQDYLKLQTREGKEVLRKTATKALQDLMMKEIGEKGVETVLFTNFVMQ